MCGIAGICQLYGDNPVSVDSVWCMIRMLTHRGPDESGIYIDDRIGMGNARLSIIDIENGTQPIHNENKTLWIVFNGEIYNYRQLRLALQNEGHHFYTASDTEVVLHLFENEGPACVSRLNGQFAIAIWDTLNRSLFLARDRAGIRPLHYTVQNGAFYFASEIKSLFAANDIDRAIDPIALDQVFTFWTTLPRHTIFKDIHELEPGHYLTVSEGNMQTRQYWDFPLHCREEYLDLAPEAICEHVKSLIRDAVKIRLIADVPVGSYLSGGLDSSGISAMIAGHFNENLETYGLRFEEEAFDESPHQTHMAEFLGVNHHELYVRNSDIAKQFEKVVWHCEKPILRTAPVPMYLLSKSVSENRMKVVLTGEGADEVFGGYDIFKEALIRHFWARQPDSAMRAQLLTRIYPDIFKNPALKKSLIAFFRQGLEFFDDPLFSHMIRWNNTARIKNFFSADTREQIGNYNSIDILRHMLPSKFLQCGILTKAQYLESKLFLSNYLLSSQGDRPAAANAVESRMPFLDHRIIEFMSRVPPAWKILGLNEKHLLKKVFSDLLPQRIVSRRKTPYRAPIFHSLISGNGNPLCHDLLGRQAIEQAGYFSADKVARLVQKTGAAKTISEVDGMALAGIFSTQLIHRLYVENFPRVSGVPTRPDLIIDNRYPNNTRLCQ